MKMVNQTFLGDKQPPLHIELISGIKEKPFDGFLKSNGTIAFKIMFLGYLMWIFIEELPRQLRETRNHGLDLNAPGDAGEKKNEKKN